MELFCAVAEPLQNSTMHTAIQEKSSILLRKFINKKG